MRRFFRLLGERARDFFTNWHGYDGPVLRKLSLTIRNRSRALFSAQQCCGHPGQPGC